MTAPLTQLTIEDIVEDETLIEQLFPSSNAGPIEPLQYDQYCFQVPKAVICEEVIKIWKDPMEGIQAQWRPLKWVGVNKIFDDYLYVQHPETRHFNQISATRHDTIDLKHDKCNIYKKCAVWKADCTSEFRYYVFTFVVYISCL